MQAEWKDGRCSNLGGPLPVWGGKGPPPAVGAVITCNDRPRTRCTVTGHAVVEGFLMVEGYRTDDPKWRGNLAGVEILWPD